MTSKKLSSAKGVLGLQWELCRRRVWLTALSALAFLLYFPVAVVLFVTRFRDGTGMYWQSEAEQHNGLLDMLSGWLGLSTASAVIAAVLAVVLAVEGFAYLYNRQKLDFYESQPVRRSSRFWAIYVNGVLLYAAPYLVSLALALATAAALGALTGVMALEALYAFVRVTLLFLSVYSLAVLAAMTAGNVLTALGVTAVFLGAEPLAAVLVQSLQNAFYRTFYTGEAFRLYLSPIWYYCELLRSPAVRGVSYESGRQPTAAWLGTLFTDDWKKLLLIAVIGAAAAALAFWCYRRRGAETTGQSVLFGPFRLGFKLVVTVLVALFAGAIVGSLYAYSSGTAATLVMYAALIFTAALVACVTEAVYELNLRAAFGRVWQLLLAVAAAAVIFSIFRFDLTGYDRYAPKTDEVESAALYSYDYFTSYYNTQLETVYNTDDYFEENMFLTNVEDVKKVAQLGQRYRVETWEQTTDADKGWTATVLYRMKDGRKVYRMLTIPYTIEAADMDAVVGTEEYRRGYYQVYQPYGEESLSLLEKATLSYDAGYGKKTAEGGLYSRFAEAYKKDLERYSFSLANGEPSCGTVEVSCNDQSRWVVQDYEIYPSYENTIALLKESGIWQEAAMSAAEVAKLTVTNHHSGLWEAPESEWPAGTEPGNPAVAREYTEPEQLEQILRAAAGTNMCATWKTASYLEPEYSIEVVTRAGEQNGADEGSTYSPYWFSFRSGEVPAFVAEDTALE